MRALALAAWKQKYRKEEFFDIFREDYLEFSLDGPFQAFNVMLGAFHGNALLGVIGLTVADYRINHQIRRLGHASWLTTFRSNAGRALPEGRTGLAWEKWRQDPDFKPPEETLPVSYNLFAGIIRHCKERHIDGIFTYCESGSRSYHVVRAVSKMADDVKHVHDIKTTYPIIRIVNLDEIIEKKRISGLKRLFAKVLRMGRVAKPGRYLENIKQYETEDLPRCLQFLNTSAERNPVLTKRYDLDTLHWQFANPELSKTLLFTVGGNVRGLINYLKMDSISEDGVFTYALIDMLYIHALDRTQQICFLLAFLQILNEAGYTGALLWRQNRVDETILPTVGFRSINRKSSISFHGLSGDLDFRMMRRADVTFR